MDDKIAYPINHATVSCTKSDGYCKVDQLDITVPDENSFGQNYIVSELGSDYFRITNWTADTIDAVSEPDSTACRTTTMNLNFKIKEFYQVTRNTGRECDVLGVRLPRLDRPRVVQIVNGAKIIDEEFAKIQKSAFDVFSSEFRSRVDKITEEEKKGAQPVTK